MWADTDRGMLTSNKKAQPTRLRLLCCCLWFEWSLVVLGKQSFSGCLPQYRGLGCAIIV